MRSKRDLRTYCSVALRVTGGRVFTAFMPIIPAFFFRRPVAHDRAGFLEDAGLAPITLLFMLLLISLLTVGYIGQLNNSPQFLFGSPAIAAVATQAAEKGSTGGLGARIYNEKCAGCHGKNGEGSRNLFPPLAGDPVVTAADPHDHIRTVLFGRHGAIIGGVTYKVYMPSWAGELSDSEIAAVINHERTSWGNSAPTVTPGEVARLRSEGP